MEFLKDLGAVAGVGGLALGVFALLFRDVLTRVLEANFSKAQAYRLFRLFMVLVFSLAVVGISAYVVLQFKITNFVVSSCTPVKRVENGVIFVDLTTGCSPKVKAKESAEAARLALEKVRLVNGAVVLPAMEAYLEDPTPSTWKVVRDQIQSIEKVITQAKDSLRDLDTATALKIETDYKKVNATLMGRAILITSLPVEPMSVDDAKSWFADYSERANELRTALANISAKLAAV